MPIPNLKLNTGATIPQVGLGLWRVGEPDFQKAFDASVAAGYRHFDDAQAYGNEQLLGQAWKASGLKREDFFITTKIDIKNFRYEKAKASFAESLEKLQTDYVDLVLLHFPMTKHRRKQAWKALEEIHAAGQATAIGVANFQIKHLKHMERYAKVMPHVNQVEFHVFLQQNELLDYCREQNILIEAYSPLAHAQELDNQAVKDIAAKHDKSYAQVMLRWLVELKVVILPKSVTPSRIQDNVDIYDFKLDADDMALLAKQNKNLRTVWKIIFFKKG